MDFGRRHKFPGSEIKDVIFMAQQAQKHQTICISSPSPNSQMAMRRGPSGTCTWEGLFHRKVQGT